MNDPIPKTFEENKNIFKSTQTFDKIIKTLFILEYLKRKATQGMKSAPNETVQPINPKMRTLIT